MNLIWQQNSPNLDNVENLATITQWWTNLNGQEIVWQQRLIPDNGNLDDISWSEQRFDEKFVLQTPQLRGITVFWHKHNAPEERDITAKKLELDTFEQKLYIYPQSQPKVVICVTLPKIAYQTIELNQPQIVGRAKDDRYLLLLRDVEQKLEITVTVSTEQFQKLLESLKQT